MCHTFRNDHLRGTVTLTPVVEQLAVELSLPVLTTLVGPDRGSNPDPNSKSAASRKRSTCTTVVL